MSHTDDLSYWLLKQVIMADEPLAHPSLEDVPDSVVRDQVRSMLDRGLVEGELHTTPRRPLDRLPRPANHALGAAHTSADASRRLTEHGGPNASRSDRRAKEALRGEERKTAPAAQGREALLVDQEGPPRTP